MGTTVLDPVVDGVQLHLAVPTEMATVEQPEITDPFSVNENVPDGL